MRGQPDYGMYAPKEVTASISDMGEVAARLGSIVIYDKRGDVVDFDNFEEPVLRWRIDAGLPETIQFNSLYPRSGSQCLRLYADGVGSDPMIYSNISILGSSRLGFEVSFNNLSGTTDLQFYNQFYSGTHLLRAGIKVDRLNSLLYIRDAADNWVLYQDLIKLTSPCYYTMKYVVDFSTGYYVRVMFGKLEYDASTIQCYSMVSVAAPQIGRIIQLVTKAAAAGVVDIDDFVQTQAEP